MVVTYPDGQVRLDGPSAGGTLLVDPATFVDGTGIPRLAEDLRPLVPAPSPRITFDKEKHKYHLDGVWIPGVTTILKVLDKPALPWWGMTVGVDGLLQLIDLEGIEVVDLPVERIVALLTVHKLTTNHVLKRAGKRGDKAHKGLETGLLNPADAPPEARGYLRSAANYRLAMRPRVLATEVMVWSEEHGFAGTFDVLAEFPGRGIGLADYKTSKRVYDEHHLQLAAYEGARLEHGCLPVDFTAVVHLTPDGEFNPDSQFVEGAGTFEQFLAVKGAYDAMGELKSTLKQRGTSSR